MVGAGANIILGHHPHVPQGVEIIGRSYVAYSMGNLIFGHNHDYWSDNYLVQVEFSKSNIEQFVILPIAGSGSDLSQPYLLQGERAEDTLAAVNQECRRLSTTIHISNGVGIALPTDMETPI